MCGRYTLAGPTVAALRDRFPALGEEVALRPRFNVAPSQEVVAITGRGGELLRWGLVPPWASAPAPAATMINARAETVAEKPAYRDAFARRRCLILADGFYEWQRRAGGLRQPHHVALAGGESFAFAGLWASWRDEHGDELRTCTIVTTEASPSLHAIHPRMPVMLPAAAEAAWLDAATPAPLLHALLVALSDAATVAREVGPAVSDARHDAPDCLDPPPAGSAAEQLALGL